MFIKPNIFLDSVTEITTAVLNSINVKALILDADNTLALPHKGKPAPGVEEWISSLQKSGIKLIILSNAKPERMSHFAECVGLPFVAWGLKPLPFGFIRAARQMKTPLCECAIVGDQLFTDLLGGGICGCKKILVQPMMVESSFGFKIKRGLEKPFLKRYKNNKL